MRKILPVLFACLACSGCAYFQGWGWRGPPARDDGTVIPPPDWTNRPPTSAEAL